MSSITASVEMDQAKPEELAKFLTLFSQDVVAQVNGKLDFQTNFNCKLISVTFSAANTNVSASHGLGRIPAGYIVTSSSASANVFNGTSGHTTSVINLQASAAATVGLLVY